MKYRVEDEDGWSAEIEAFDAQYAAEQGAGRINAESASYPDERDVTVTDPDGVVTRWTVCLTMEPVYTAVETI